MHPHQNRERLLALAEPLIRRKARRLIGRAGLTAADRDDVEQELALALWARRGSYRADRGEAEAFASLVIDHAARGLLRHRRAKKRQPGALLSLDRAAGGGWSEPAAPPGPASAGDLRLDLEALLARLPQAERELARSLATETVAELARRLALAPSTLRSRLRRLRERFDSAGLRDYLPS